MTDKIQKLNNSKKSRGGSVKKREPEELQDLSKGGWMMKKGQARWFVIKNHVVYWFAEKRGWNSDMAQGNRGSMSLENAEVEINDKELKIACAGKSYVLKEKKGSGTIQEWYAVFDEKIQACAKSKTKYAKYSKEGWLRKKGKDRYFKLKGDRFYWYNNPTLGTENGSLDLAVTTVSEVLGEGDKAHFILGSLLKGKPYKLECNGIHDARAWVKAIDASIKHAKNRKSSKKKRITTKIEEDVTFEGSGMKKNKVRYFILKNGNLLWYLSNPNEKNQILNSSKVRIQGTLNLLDCEISRDGYSVLINPMRGKMYDIVFDEIKDAKIWEEKLQEATALENLRNAKNASSLRGAVATKISGWVEKKYIGKDKVHKRYLLLDRVELKYFDTDDQNATPKGSIQLTKATVSRIDDNTFTINSLDGRSFPWVAKTKEECTEWINSINIYIINSDSVYAEVGIKKHGYLGKKGEERWFVIKDRVLYWYNHVVSIAELSESNGQINLFGCNVVSSASEFFFVLETENEKPYKLFARNELDLTRWVEAIQDAATEAKQPGLVFGTTLESIAEREGSDVPILVQKTIEYVTTYGPSTQGIFRLSGQATEISAYRDAYDKGEVPDFEAERADVNAAAGLLKSFLRELEIPLIPFNLYKTFITVTNVPSLQTAILKLDTLYYTVCKELFKFLNMMLQYSAVTCMEASNIAIVFGPNILRQDNTDDNLMASSFIETPMILRVIQLMISNYYELFEDLPPVPDELPPPPMDAEYDYSESMSSEDDSDIVAPPLSMDYSLDLPMDLPPPMELPTDLPPIELNLPEPDSLPPPMVIPEGLPMNLPPPMDSVDIN